MSTRRKRQRQHERTTSFPDAVIAVGTIKVPFWARIKLLFFGKLELRTETPVSRVVKMGPGLASAYMRWPDFIENWRERRRKHQRDQMALAMMERENMGAGPQQVPQRPDIAVVPGSELDELENPEKMAALKSLGVVN